jgi:type IV pilus assembly protein PilQ
LALLVGTAQVARAEVNVVSKVTARADGAKTIVTVTGSATPSFTAYRLERPSRVVVDLADGKLGASDGPMDVDTWAVSQIGTAQYADESSRTARVMISFKRPSTYDVRAKGHDVIIIVTPDEMPPPGSLNVEDLRVQSQTLKSETANLKAQTESLQHEKANLTAQVTEARKQAESARHEAEQAAARAAQARKEEEKRLEAVQQARAEEEKRALGVSAAKKAEIEAQARTDAAKREADEARARVQAAQAELERVIAAKKAAAQAAQANLDQKSAASAAAQAELAKLDRQKSAASAAAQAELAKLDRSLAARRADAEAELARLAAAKQATEDRLARLKAEAAQAGQKTSTELQKSTAELQKTAAETERLRSELARVSAAKQAEEARLAKLKAEVAQAGQKTSAELQKSAAELQKSAAELQKTAAETERLRAEREKEQKRLEALRAEAEQLMRARDEQAKKLEAAQAEARKRKEAETAHAEAERQAAERRAQAVAAAEKAEERKLKAQSEEAERLARAAQQLAETESARADAETKAKKAAEAAQRELAKLDHLRAEAAKVQADAQAARMEVNRQRVESERLSALQEAERAHVERERAEAKKLMDKRADEASRALHAAAMASQSSAKLEAAEREARRVAQERQKELDRLEQARAEAQALQGRRAEELKKIEQARAEAQKQATQREAELKALADKRGQEELRLKKAQAELDRVENERRAALDGLSRDQSKLRAENATLQERVEKARNELVRLKAEADARLAVVPTPTKVAAPTPKSPAKLRETLPVQKVAARVEDVRFSDEGDRERVTVNLKGDAQYTVLHADAKTAVLRIAGAEVPKKLERTLDVAAYQGPLRSVSTYTDPEDPGAVRVVANFDGDAGEGAAQVTRDGNQLSWDFPKPQARSYPPQKVGAYGTSIPLQVQAANPGQTLPGRGGAGRARHVYSGRRISLDFKDIDIHNVLRLLADVGQVNIVTSDDVKGSVTIRMVDVPWDQALDVILRAKGLGMQREGNLIRVAPAGTLEKELEQEIARAKAAVELKPIDTRLIQLSYADANNMVPKVQDVLSPRGKVTVDARTNMLIVSDVAGNIALAEELVHNLDTQTPQVLIEARIVEARTTFLRDIGIQWGGSGLASAATGNPTGIAFPSTVGVGGGATDGTTPTAGILGGQAANPNFVVNMPAAVGTGSGGALGLTLGSVNGAVNVNLRLSSLENTGNVRIISAPKITTLDNIEAAIEQGVAIPISVVSAAGTNTQFVDAKLNLTVKPHVTAEGSVIMHVQITRNEPDFVNTGARGDPTILKKQARTEMLVRDGDTAVIGGIYTRNTGLSYAKVPWFADIPVIGWLFKNRRENDDRTELLIFITPRIVNRAVVKR